MDNRNIMERSSYRNMQGVTLMELMIVVMIVGILAAVAYPNYRDYAARAKRNEAKAALLQIATNQERFYLNNNSYANELTQLGFATDPAVSPTGSYTIDIAPGADSTNFSASAVYNFTDNEASKCSSFGLDGRGQRTSAPYTDCWTRRR